MFLEYLANSTAYPSGPGFTYVENNFNYRVNDLTLMIIRPFKISVSSWVSFGNLYSRIFSFHLSFQIN